MIDRKETVLDGQADGDLLRLETLAASLHSRLSSYLECSVDADRDCPPEILAWNCRGSAKICFSGPLINRAAPSQRSLPIDMLLLGNKSGFKSTLHFSNSFWTGLGT